MYPYSFRLLRYIALCWFVFYLLIPHIPFQHIFHSSLLICHTISGFIIHPDQKLFSRDSALSINNHRHEIISKPILRFLGTMCVCQKGNRGRKLFLHSYIQTLIKVHKQGCKISPIFLIISEERCDRLWPTLSFCSELPSGDTCLTLWTM